MFKVWCVLHVVDIVELVLVWLGELCLYKNVNTVWLWQVAPSSAALRSAARKQTKENLR